MRHVAVAHDSSADIMHAVRVQEKRVEVLAALTDMVQYAIDVGTDYSIGDLDFGLQQDTATFEQHAEVGCHSDLHLIACEPFSHDGLAQLTGACLAWLG